MGSFYGVSDAALDAAMASGLELPGHRPPLRSTHVGADGSVWIELDGPHVEWTTWVVLAPDLSPRGRLDLPPRMRPRYVDGAVFWMVELDEMEVPWLVRIRVE